MKKDYFLHKILALGLFLFVPLGMTSEIVVTSKLKRNKASQSESMAEEGSILQPTSDVDFVLNGAGENLFNQDISIDIKSKGGASTLSEARIRGGNPSHTLVLIDSMRVGDTSSPQLTQNLSHLERDHFSGFSLHAGANSTEFGSDALSGSLNLVPKTLVKKSYFEFGGGSEQSQKIALGIGRNLKRSRFSIQLSQFKQEGENLSNNPVVDELDEYNRQNVLLSYLIKAKHPWQFLYMGSFSEAALDGNFGEEDLDSTEKNEQQFMSISHYRVFRQGRQKLSFRAAVNRTKREYKNLNANDLLLAPDSKALFTPQTDEWENHFFGESLQTRMDWEYKLPGKSHWSWGLDRYEQSAENRTVFNSVKGEFKPQSREQLAGFIQGKKQSGNGGYHWGLRQEHYDSFEVHQTAKTKHLNKKEITYSLRPFYKLTSFQTISLGVASGFKLPSLYELLDPYYGNSELKPERSQSTDLTWEYKGKSIGTSLSLFKSQFKDLITASSEDNWRAKNIDKASSEGIETSLSRDFGATNLSLGYQYLKAKNDVTDQELLDRPHGRVLAQLKQRLHPHFDLTWQGQYIGERKGYSDKGVVDMPSYSVHNLNGLYKWSPRVRINLSINNIFDESYEKVSGFSTPGLGVFAAVKVIQ